jgi:hypothetical protein
MTCGCKAQNLDAALDAVQVAQLGVQIGQQVQHAVVSSLLALLQGQVAADLAHDVVAVADVRAAAAAVQQMIAELHDRSVDAALRRGCGQGDVHFLELIVDICHKKKPLFFFSDAAETGAAAG